METFRIAKTQTWVLQLGSHFVDEERGSRRGSDSLDTPLVALGRESMSPDFWHLLRAGVPCKRPEHKPQGRAGLGAHIFALSTGYTVPLSPCVSRWGHVPALAPEVSPEALVFSLCLHRPLG